MKVHYSSNKHTWETPQDFFDKLNSIYGFTLDACAEWHTAKVDCYYTKEQDALIQDWKGIVWCNPPYGRQTWLWLDKLATHGRGTALIFARTETKGFVEQVWNKASGLLFLHGRLFFYRTDGTPASANAGAPSVLVAYGREDAECLRCSLLEGTYVAL